MIGNERPTRMNRFTDLYILSQQSIKHIHGTRVKEECWRWCALSSLTVLDCTNTDLFLPSPYLPIYRIRKISVFSTIVTDN